MAPSRAGRRPARRAGQPPESAAAPRLRPRRAAPGRSGSGPSWPSASPRGPGPWPAPDVPRGRPRRRSRPPTARPALAPGPRPRPLRPPPRPPAGRRSCDGPRLERRRLRNRGCPHRGRPAAPGPVGYGRSACWDTCWSPPPGPARAPRCPATSSTRPAPHSACTRRAPGSPPRTPRCTPSTPARPAGGRVAVREDLPYATGTSLTPCWPATACPASRPPAATARTRLPGCRPRPHRAAARWSTAALEADLPPGRSRRRCTPPVPPPAAARSLPLSWGGAAACRAAPRPWCLHCRLARPALPTAEGRATNGPASSTTPAAASRVVLVSSAKGRPHGGLPGPAGGRAA